MNAYEYLANCIKNQERFESSDDEECKRIAAVAEANNCVCIVKDDKTSYFADIVGRMENLDDRILGFFYLDEENNIRFTGADKVTGQSITLMPTPYDDEK
jgi:hypothetical protein